MNEVLNDLSSLRWNKHYRLWKPFMEKYNCQRICEVGVRKGLNFEKMIKHNPEVAVAVDIWADTGDIAVNDKGYSQEQLNSQYNNLVARIGDLPNVKIIRDYSTNVAEEFEDNYFDLVYLDADHTFEGVCKDIHVWYPKVKHGGFLLGDDFVNRKTRTGVRFGVVKAVTNFAMENDLSFFVFPRYKWGIIKP